MYNNNHPRRVMIDELDKLDQGKKYNLRIGEPDSPTKEFRFWIDAEKVREIANIHKNSDIYLIEAEGVHR